MLKTVITHFYGATTKGNTMAFKKMVLILVFGAETVHSSAGIHCMLTNVTVIKWD